MNVPLRNLFLSCLVLGVPITVTISRSANGSEDPERRDEGPTWSYSDPDFEPREDAWVRAQGHAEGADGAGPVALQTRLTHGYLLRDAPEDVYLVVTLAADDARALERPPMNLALVIDSSGSMGSERKLTHAKSAARELIRRLEPTDRMAILTYSDEVGLLVPSTPTMHGHQDVFHAAIDSIRAEGRTNLYGGLSAGHREVHAHADPARVNHVLLLSDGLANVGTTRPRDIERRIRHYREDGVRVTTMGMGVQYDEDLLLGIAQETGGNYHYVRDAEFVAGFLEEELLEISSAVARNMVLEVELGPGVDLHEVYGYRWRQEGRRVLIPMRDMQGGEGRKAVMRLDVRPGARAEQAVADVTLRYDEARDLIPYRIRAPRETVTFTADAGRVRENMDLAALIKVEVVRNAEALDQAMRRQKRGQVDQARALLLARYRDSKALNESRYRSAEVSRILARMNQVVDELETTRGDQRAMRDLQLETQLRALGYAE